MNHLRRQFAAWWQRYQQWRRRAENPEPLDLPVPPGHVALIYEEFGDPLDVQARRRRGNRPPAPPARTPRRTRRKPATAGRTAMADLAHAAEGDVDLIGDTDARHWAERFAHRLAQYGASWASDEGTMLTWFASAIETGRTAGE